MIKNPVPWPNGARCAVAITFDVDSDSTLHLKHRQRADTLVAAQSWMRYDEVAVPRIVEMFKRFGLKQTFFFPAWCMEKYPQNVEVILEEGHEIAHHGYLHENPNDLSGEEELYWLHRGIEVIERMTGKRPRGWRAPSFNFSKHSADFLAQEGFLYDASLMGDDVPYLLDTKAGQVIELPSQWPMDDWPHYTHSREMDYMMPIKSPDEAMNVYMSEFEAMWDHGGLLVAVWHPFVSGRLARCARVAKMIEEMLNKGGVWFATLEEIALHVRKCIDDGTYKPRIDNLPYYDGPIPELPPEKAG